MEAIFYQLFEPESSTYTYLVADPVSKEAALIDPVRETVDRDLQLIADLGVTLKYVLDTHVHADHITGAGEIRRRTGAKTGLSKAANVDCADIALTDGQELTLGERKLQVLATPGHTDSCLCFLFEDRVFTGDTLLIRGCGRTDFQEGSAERLYDSVQQKLFTLGDSVKVYPAHDYRGQTASTISLEKRFNPRLGRGRTKPEFVKIMAELKLAEPKKIREAVPANRACGGKTETAVSRNLNAPAEPVRDNEEEKVLSPILNDGVPEVSVEQVQASLGRVRLIDVRRPDEFSGELGHVQGAELVTLGPDLVKFLEAGDRGQEIVFICRSGGRSGQATGFSQQLGYQSTANMVGGMLRWNEAGFEVKR